MNDRTFAATVLTPHFMAEHRKIAEMVIEEEIDTATIGIGNGLKAKISVTSKGLIKVERSKTEKDAEEV